MYYVLNKYPCIVIREHLYSHKFKKFNFRHKMFSSLLWEYFVKVEGGTASCKKCLKNFQTISGNTSSLRKHLQSMHKEQYAKIVEEEKTYKGEIGRR